MSLILDALRKSEAERRRGQSPSLYSSPPVPGTRLAPAWMRYLPVLLGALLLATVAWFLLRDAGEPATKSELEESAGAPSLVPEPAPETVIETVGTDVPAATVSPVAVPAAPTAAPAPGVDALVQAPPATTPREAPAPASDVAAAPPVAAPVPAATPAPAAPAPAAADALPPVAVLDAGTRSALPPMKLSMHVYNADPARRFAIVDGQRVTEGAQLGSASVVEIRRDGVVLEVGGRRVLLPRP